MTDTYTPIDKTIEKQNQKARVIIKENQMSLPLKIASGAIFGAISLVVSLLTTEILPRVQWGLALFDPVSIVWIIAFFCFGYETGLITSFIGMFLLMPFDPFTPIGPIMKFVATVPLIIVPWIISKIRKLSLTSKNTLKFSNYILNWSVAVVLRVIIMVYLNYLVISLMFPSMVAGIDLGFLGLPGLTGWTAIFGTVIFLNILQSVWDYGISLGLVKAIQLGVQLPW